MTEGRSPQTPPVASLRTLCTRKAPKSKEPPLPLCAGDVSPATPSVASLRTVRIREQPKKQRAFAAAMTGGVPLRHPAVDQVHFDAPYQVHRPCPRSPSEPHWVYQVHPLKSNLVQLTRKTPVARGTEALLRPRRPQFPPARGARALLRPRRLLSCLPGALGPLSAPGNCFFLQPGALRPFSAPRNREDRRMARELGKRIPRNRHSTHF